jgi:hypothetical protein
VFFDQPTPVHIRAGVRRLTAESWEAAALKRHAARYHEEQFIDRLQQVVNEELGSSAQAPPHG